MIKKTLATLLFSSALLVSSLSFAETLEHNMETLAKNYKAFNKAENTKDAQKALDGMKTAALDAKKVKLKTADRKAPTSDALYDQLIGQIDKTSALLKAGQLAQAKIEGQKLKTIRDAGHSVYHHH